MPDAWPTYQSDYKTKSLKQNGSSSSIFVFMNEDDDDPDENMIMCLDFAADPRLTGLTSCGTSYQYLLLMPFWTEQKSLINVILKVDATLMFQDKK